MPSGKRAPEGESNHRRRNLMTIRGASLQRSKLISRAPGWRIRPLYMWPVTTTSRECGPTANCVHITAAMRSAYVKGKQVNIISGFRRGRVVGPAVDVFLPPRKRREPTPPPPYGSPDMPRSLRRPQCHGPPQAWFVDTLPCQVHAYQAGFCLSPHHRWWLGRPDLLWPLIGAHNLRHELELPRGSDATVREVGPGCGTLCTYTTSLPTRSMLDRGISTYSILHTPYACM